MTLGISNHAMGRNRDGTPHRRSRRRSRLSQADALGLFLPVTLISVPTGIAMGLAIDRFPMRFLIMGMMVGQVLMFGLAPHLGDPTLYRLCIAAGDSRAASTGH